MPESGLCWLTPEWPVAPHVRALVTTRVGGVSLSPYASLNLATHVQDDPQAVAENRRRLALAAGLPQAPRWLEQVHGTTALRADTLGEVACGDAAFTAAPGVVCAVLTADCLPVLLADVEGGEVAAIHAGWRGLVDGVIERTLASLATPRAQLVAWLGPAIGPSAFEVGTEVRDAFIAQDPGAHCAFCPSPQGRWLADLYTLARRRLAQAGVRSAYGGDYCTFSEPQRFYSYRRDGLTGRMASLIWLE